MVLRTSFCFSFLLFFYSQFAAAQWNDELLRPISLENLSFFSSPSSNWNPEGKANCLRDVNLNITTSPGSGVLVNRPTAVNKENLVSAGVFGDVDLEFDFMLSKGSNSGVYLMGRYEIQLFDSWGKEAASFADCGGVYQRWDPARGKGREGYEGYAPAANACKAPGLWQTMRISFEAPVFDPTGRKTKNATMRAVWLNGAKLHTQLVLSGPTKGSLYADEQATGPLVFQSDHGPVAFRNLRMASFGGRPLLLKGLSYSAWHGVFSSLQVPEGRPVFKADSGLLINKADAESDDDFYIRYRGKLTAFQSGEYRFTAQFSGRFAVLVDGDTVIKSYTNANWWDKYKGSIRLQPGEYNLEVVNAKSYPERKNAMGLSYTGPGLRETILHAETSIGNGTGPTQLVLQTEAHPYVQRSFYLHKGIRKAYGINVCDPSGTHFTLNAQTGRINRAWHSAQFGEATDMWVDRGGEQLFTPNAFCLELTDKALLGPSPDSYVDSLTDADGFSFLGYQLKNSQQPTFCYYTRWGELLLQATFVDYKLVLEGVLKQANFHQSIPFHLVAEGKRIEKLDDGSFLVDDAYYVRPDVSIDASTKVTDASGMQRLYIQMTGVGNDMKFKYSLIW